MSEMTRLAIAKTRAERAVRLFRAWPERFTTARYWLLGGWLIEVAFRAVAWDWR